MRARAIVLVSESESEPVFVSVSVSVSVSESVSVSVSVSGSVKTFRFYRVARRASKRSLSLTLIKPLALGGRRDGRRERVEVYEGIFTS